MTILNMSNNDRLNTVEELMSYLKVENDKNVISGQFKNPSNLENVLTVNKGLIGCKELEYHNILAFLIECKAVIDKSPKSGQLLLILERYNTIKKMVLGSQKAKTSYLRRDVMLYELIYLYHNAQVYLNFKSEVEQLKAVK